MSSRASRNKSTDLLSTSCYHEPAMHVHRTEFDVLVAYDRKTRGIGRHGLMPWHLPPDLREFKRRTMGHILILGRKTWDSIGRTPLPGRFHVVITKTPHRYWSSTQSPCVAFVSCFENALIYATMMQERIGPFFRKQVFVVGGEQVYRNALDHPRCRYVFATEVQWERGSEPSFDAFFPSFEHRDHVRVSKSDWNVCANRRGHARASRRDANPRGTIDARSIWFRYVCFRMLE